MKCPNCGRSVRKGAAVCPKCQAPLNAPDPKKDAVPDADAIIREEALKLLEAQRAEDEGRTAWIGEAARRTRNPNPGVNSRPAAPAPDAPPVYDARTRRTAQPPRNSRPSRPYDEPRRRESSLSRAYGDGGGPKRNGRGDGWQTGRGAAYYAPLSRPAAVSVVRDPLRETGRSGLFLIAALVFALAAAARILWPDAILSGTVNALGTAQRFASALGAGGSKIYAELGSLLTLITGIGDLTSVLSGLGLNLTGVKIAYSAGVFLAVLPDLIAFAGLLAAYARSRKGLGKSGGRATGNVRGCLTVIQTAEILGFLFLTVSALAFGFTCLAEGLRNGAARMQRAGFAAFLTCFVLIALALLRCVLTFRAMSAAKRDVYGVLGKKIPGFTVFFLIAEGVICLFAAVFAPAAVPAGLSSILFAAVLIRYRRKATTEV